MKDGIENVRLPSLLRSLVNMPWARKRTLAARPQSWRLWAGLCRRGGWDASRLGWHAAINGPYSGIRLQALHPNHLWVPLGTYELPISEWIVRLLTDCRWGAAGKDVWDVGANIGIITLLCAKETRGRVLAFEPAAANLLRLRENLAANPELAERIEGLPAAVSDRDGEVEFEEGAASENQIIHREVPAWQGRPGNRKTTVVPSLRLDSLLDQGRSAPGLLKIDIEGAEVLALSGARNLLHSFHPVVLLEVHNVEAGAASVALLREAGYSIRRIEGRRLRDLTVEAVPYGHLLAVTE